jgi:hypothetical protein
MDQLITLSEIIKKTVKINNRFLERFLEKKVLIISGENIIVIERNIKTL